MESRICYFHSVMAFLEGLQALSTDWICINHPIVLSDLSEVFYLYEKPYRFETTDMHPVFSEADTGQGSSVTSQLLSGQMRHQLQLAQAAAEEPTAKVDVTIPADPWPSLQGPDPHICRASSQQLWNNREERIVMRNNFYKAGDCITAVLQLK